MPHTKLIIDSLLIIIECYRLDYSSVLSTIMYSYWKTNIATQIIEKVCEQNKAILSNNIKNINIYIMPTLYMFYYYLDIRMMYVYTI